MQNFRDALNVCNLEDMGDNGDIFTWRRGRIRERLDRAVCNNRWGDMFPMAGALNENFSKSDHRPIIVNCQFYENVEERAARGRKMFEVKWLLEENFDDIVSKAWNRAQSKGPRSIAQKLNEVHRSLHAWDMQTLKEPHRHSRELQEKLNSVMEGPLSDEATSQQQRIQLSIEQILVREELKWVQRSRANWMKSGDQNTHFFRNFATGRKKRNLIKKLPDANKKYGGRMGLLGRPYK
jgi:hypothetical protein